MAVILTGMLSTACSNGRKFVKPVDASAQETEIPAQETTVAGSEETQTTAAIQETVTAPQATMPPQETATAADPFLVSSGSSVVSHDEKIRYIQNAYQRTIANRGTYQQSGGRYYTAGGVLAEAAVSNGDSVLDNAMSKNGYSTYTLDYYFDDTSTQDNYPLLICAVIDGKAYEYYFWQGEFIRRVGPEGGGNTNDAPQANTFINTLRDRGLAYRGEQTAAPVQTPVKPATRAEQIAYVQNVYEDIVRNQANSYSNGFGGYYNQDGGIEKAILLNGNGSLALNEAMRKNGYSVYELEYYYDRMYVSSGEDPVLIHARIDGKEYWYYFFNGEFIRRVGPEGGGNTNDAPNVNDFIIALRDEGASLRTRYPSTGCGA